VSNSSPLARQPGADRLGFLFRPSWPGEPNDLWAFRENN
jgi:hypothetical protein